MTALLGQEGGGGHAAVLVGRRKGISGGRDDGGGRCAVALLGRQRHWGMIAVAGLH
jgi:hypothetical protein